MPEGLLKGTQVRETGYLYRSYIGIEHRVQGFPICAVSYELGLSLGKAIHKHTQSFRGFGLESKGF